MIHGGRPVVNMPPSLALYTETTKDSDLQKYTIVKVASRYIPQSAGPQNCPTLLGM